MNKALERELEKCVWLVKEERLRLGANELSERHRNNIRELVDELQINCREYAKLDGRGSSDRRKTALRYSRLFQKAIDEYVTTTQLTKPTSDYLDALERLQENIVEVLRFQQRKQCAIRNAEPSPCECFAREKKKKEVLALVEEVAERQNLRRCQQTQTEADIAAKESQTHLETAEEGVQFAVEQKSVGVGDSILIDDLPHLTSSSNSTDPSSSAELSLGNLLLQFRKVMRDEVATTTEQAEPRPKSARIRFEKLHRMLDESGLSGASDVDNSERQ
ncbi:uncharacterized protein LOC100909066 [Galendromus occidentalis]|uniref:Uncharacterized protein LOC100909066 n=1 Tax=Galendromus occidentalis TaxID=34638 RepID=A0AAJ7SDT1_9ACAR|nr:uncharacterized protein LOC100909066 [Galendromus occidentalis]